MAEKDPWLQKLMAGQTQGDPTQKILPEELYKQIQSREKADPHLSRLRDIARAMQAGPIVAGAMELSKLRGGSGVNLNPALQWASGLAGAPKNTAAMASTPHRSPMDAIQGLMGMGAAAETAQSKYLAARDRFRAQQGGSAASGKMGPFEAMMMRDYLRDQNEEKKWGRQDKKEGESLEREAAQKWAELDLKKKDSARKTYADWTVLNQKKNYPRIAANATDMLEAFRKNPDSLYLDAFGHRFNKMSLPSFAQSAEGKQFYAALQGFINPILKGDIGSQQTAKEAARFSKALSVGAFDSFDQLKKSYNTFIEAVAKEYDDSLKLLKTSAGDGYAYNYMWKIQDAPGSDYGRILRKYKLVTPKTPATKSKDKPKGSAEFSKEDSATMDAFDKLTESLKGIE